MLVARKRPGGLYGGRTQEPRTTKTAKLTTAAEKSGLSQVGSFVKDITPLAGVLAKGLADVGTTWLAERRAGQEAERKRKEDMEAAERRRKEKMEEEAAEDLRYEREKARKAEERREELEYKKALKALGGRRPPGRSTTPSQGQEQALQDADRLSARYPRTFAANPTLVARVGRELTEAIEAPADPEDPQYYRKVLSEIERGLALASPDMMEPASEDPQRRRPQPAVPGWPLGMRPKALGGKTGISPLAGSRSASTNGLTARGQRRGGGALWGGGIATPVFD